MIWCRRLKRAIRSAKMNWVKKHIVSIVILGLNALAIIAFLAALVYVALN